MAIFASMYINITFSHLHIVDGQLILHSHLTENNDSDKGTTHKHSKTEIIVLDANNNLYNKTIIEDIYTNDKVNVFEINETSVETKSFDFETIFADKNLRAPPSIS